MSWSHHTAVRLAAAAAAIAGSLFALPAMAENSWTGSRLVVNGVGAQNCRITVTRAYGGTTLSGIWLTIRNAGSGSLDLDGTMRLEGNGSSKTGTMGFMRVPAGTTVEKASQLTVYGGNMATTKLTVNVTRCTPST